MAFRLIAKQIQRGQISYKSMMNMQTSMLRFSSVIKLEMPALSPTMSEGNIVQWNKKEGDQVKVGDVICEIQTDKATVGFESQEEGFLAKILVSKDAKGVQVGQLIGLLVEEKGDIASIDISKYQASTAPQQQQPKNEVSKTTIKEEKSVKQEQSHSHQDYDKEFEKQAKTVKMSPSATFYLRTYQILPSEVKATGEKNFISKGDVTKYIALNKIEKGQTRKIESTQKVETKKEETKTQQAKPQAKGTTSQNGEPDKFNLFKQSWTDQKLDDKGKQTGQNILQAKKSQAHSYLSAYCQVDNALRTLQSFDSKLNVDSVIIKAASKAFQKTFKMNDIDLARVSPQSVRVIKSSEKLNISQISNNKDQVINSSNFAADIPSNILLEIHSVTNSIEALPIANPHSYLTLHYTEPQTEVVVDAPLEDLYQDIATIGDKQISEELKLKTTKRVRLSVSFDGSKIDELQAVQFLHKIQTFVNDPDMMLL